MTAIFQKGIKLSEVSRREFLVLASLSTAGFLSGCAANPVTGKSQLLLISEHSEIEIDKKNSPYQFSADYGRIQDKGLNTCLDQTGKKMASMTHRPHMPYSFQGVNATYVNAYAFPGGSIAATRGILLTLENEAELAALLGHELGHVNARHTAQQMSKTMVTQAVIAGVSVYAGSKDPSYGWAASSLGMIGAGALLASYSRENEYEADALGLEYMVKSGYHPQGFEGLMDMLRSLSKHKPSTIELMFATHPMSDERYRIAVESIKTQYQSGNKNPVYRERYMDHTAGIRKIKGAIYAMQNGEREMAGKKYDAAEKQFQKALKIAPRDYAALVQMAQCQLVRKKYTEAEKYADTAKAVYPEEARAYHLSGLAKIYKKDFDSAYERFSVYDRLLPGNPNITFFKGYSLEGMQKKERAAEEYIRYLKVVNQGKQAEHAYQRLVDWGYVK